MLKKVTEEHQLSYLLEPEVQTLAEQIGVDMKALNAYLKKNIPLFNFNYCFVEGDAFLRTVEMLKNPTLMQKAPNELKRYVLIALTYALVAPFSEPKPNIYEVGVGMVRYMRDNTGLEGQLKQSRSFHEGLTRAYFKLPNI